jgi:methyl-accepting chemotaxis protein
MIEGTVDNINSGSDLVAKVNKEFDEIFSSMEKTADLVSEIAAASGEQAIGIEQINTTVSEIDKATQDSAATSETLAAAAGSFIISSETAESMSESPVLHRPQIGSKPAFSENKQALDEIDESAFSEF